jgi:ribosomal protein S18 acetylase RimI-like enzyme
MSAPRPLFRVESVPLAAPASGGLTLSPILPDEARPLATLYAGIDPWRRYEVPVARLAGLFTPAGDSAHRLVVRGGDGAPRGIIVVRSPWLIGPYVQFLAVSPGHQGQGIGRAMMAWFEAEARRGQQRNLWICAATFNTGALRLYQSLGYEEASVLDDLIRDGETELLLRKRLRYG